MANSERRKDRMTERKRCLGLVEALRDRLERGLDNNRNNSKFAGPNHRSAFRTVEVILDLLKEVEDNIKHPENKEVADFSLDEMALAEQIIAEQNKNPFEAEP